MPVKEIKFYFLILKNFIKGSVPLYEIYNNYKLITNHLMFPNSNISKLICYAQTDLIVNDKKLIVKH